jgi:hypothetical protein
LGGVIMVEPSPNGRHLFIDALVMNNNVWMLEGF